MKPNEAKAWEILTKKEQNSLFLTLSKGQSSWEAGEILKISHYKYLELKERSEKFFQMFTQYFEGIESLVPPDAPIDARFRDYIEACIEKRLTKSESIRYMGDSAQLVNKISAKLIIKNLTRLKNSEREQDKKLYKLIMEFDRWNNWRVLPRCIQQPSAYKRRNNKREKIYINYICKIPDWKISALVDIYQYNMRGKKKPCYYIALISNDLFDDGYKVIPIRKEEEVINKLSSLFIYVFTEESHADIFGYQVTRYEEKIIKPTQGQIFWPEYRENLNRSINFNAVNNIDFYVEKLDMAYNLNPKARRQKATSSGAKRASEKIF